eukprot:GILJ01005043.1.p1 GENE.GILJ01005043.1~~GILJ01005043.1.p1  ORF type:complete len:1070 (+),score=161.11 GILJ01005043.1:3-3212(+)
MGTSSSKEGEQGGNEASHAAEAHKPVVDAEDIRRKRMARFATDSATSAEGTPIAPLVSSVAVNPATLASMSEAARATPQKPIINFIPVPPVTASGPPDKIVSSSTPSIVAPPPAKATSITSKPTVEKSPSQIEEDALGRIFLVTLVPVRESVSTTELTRPVLLRDLARELKDEGEELVLKAVLLDRILMTRLSIPTSIVSPLRYLLDCYRRVSEEPGRKQPAPESLLQECTDMIVSYTGLLLMQPDMFGLPVAPTPVHSALMQELALVVESSALPSSFLTKFVSRFHDDGLEKVVHPLITILFTRSQNSSLLEPPTGPLRGLCTLVRDKTVAELMTRHVLFLPPFAQSGRDLEQGSLLGPYLHVTALPDDPKIIETHFANPSRRTQASVNASTNELRAALTSIRRGTAELLLGLCKAGAGPRDAVLQWVSTAIQFNVQKQQMMRNPFALTSTDGFMLNLLSVLLEMCAPFMDYNSPKLSLIDPRYVLSDRLRISAESKIAPTEGDAAMLEPLAGVTWNFVTECFFLTSRCIHLGLRRTSQTYLNLLRNIVEMQNRLGISNGSNVPIPPEMEMGITQKLCFDVHLLERDQADRCVKFLSLCAVWMLRLLLSSDTADPLTDISLPLPTPPPAHWAMLPEYFLEDLMELWLFWAQIVPESLDVTDVHVMLSLFTVLLHSPQYVKNPHLRAKMAETLFHMLPDKRGGRGPSLGLVIESHALAGKHLGESLIRLYVDVEKTGSHNQFYEKFSIRYYVTATLQYLWQFPTQRKSVAVYASQHGAHFVSFVHLMLNDMTYLIDEALAKLAEIKAFQTIRSNPQEWDAMPPAQQQEREALHANTERMAKGSMQLGNETIHMLNYITESIVTPFLEPEVVDRLAATVNYCLEQLVGPKGLKLKVQEPQKYDFNPRALLLDLACIYLHLAKHPRFLQAVINDSRSYTEALMTKALKIVRREGLLAGSKLTELEALFAELQRLSQTRRNEEEQLGEVPDDMLDPIMQTIMEDPVTLPSSKVTVDRMTIVRHLLSDPTDPFNRSHLTVDMLIPNEELRARIQFFRASRQDPSDVAAQGTSE